MVVFQTVLQDYSKRYLDDHDNNFEMCSFERKDALSKIVAAAFAAYIFVQFVTKMRAYNYTANAVTYLVFGQGKMANRLSSRYVWGFIVNLMSLYWNTMGSLVLLYVSQTPLDMVLNALALSFIMEVDDNLASEVEKEAAKEALDTIMKETFPTVKSSKTIDTETGSAEVLEKEVPKDEDYGKEVYPLHPCFFGVFEHHAVFFSVTCFIVSAASPFFLFACYNSEGTREEA